MNKLLFAFWLLLTFDSSILDQNFANASLLDQKHYKSFTGPWLGKKKPSRLRG
jgi:hypothetical protein